MREVWLAVLQLAVQLALGERALAFSRKTSDWPNASVLYVLNDAPADLGTKGETTAADKTSPTSFAKVASDRSNEAVFEHTTVHPTRVFPELPTDEFSLAPAFDFPTIPRASAEAPLRSASEDTRNAVPRKEGAAVKLDPVLLGSRQDAPSFVEGSPETIRFEKGALTPAVCRQAHCGRGGSLPFFDKSKKSCFSVTSCRDCPDHSGGLETICQLHGRRKGFTTLIQNTLVPGAPSQLFKYRRATKEEIESSIVRQTPLHRVRGVAGAEGESSAGARLAAGAEDGTEEEFGEEGGQSLGEEEEYEFIQMTQSALGADEAVPSPCELSANSDASPAPSFLTVSAMPGFDSYEQDEMETLGEAEDATSQPAADASAPGRTSRSGESASFSLPASALLSPPKDCLVDHKGYTRLHLSVILASKDFRKEGAAVRDAYGPSSAFSSEGAGGSPGEGAFSAGDEGFGEDFDEFGNAGDTGGFVELGTAAPPASSFAQVADFADDDPKPGLMSKLGGLFKRNKDEEADEGGADEDDSQGKKPGIFKRLFRRKSRASEEEELGEDYEGEELPPTRSRRTKRKGHKGALSRARSAGRALKRGVAAPVKALKGPGFPARLKVQIVTAVSSPAASACSRPATWTGVLKESNLLKFAFEIRVRNVEVEAAFVDFVRSSLSVHLTCRQKSCRLEDSLLACAQVRPDPHLEGPVLVESRELDLAWLRFRPFRFRVQRRGDKRRGCENVGRSMTPRCNSSSSKSRQSSNTPTRPSN